MKQHSNNYNVKMFAFLCLTLFLGPYYAASAPNSDYVYKSEVDASLRLHLVPAIWSEAGMRCALEGGILASPTTSAMAKVMSTMMAEHNLTHVFVGINSILYTENFKSLDGVPLSSMPLRWATGQPDNNNGDEDCLMLTNEGNMADITCESVLPYICRKENKCGPKKNGYKWEPRTGSCYKFHRQGTWRKAQATCHKEGAHLAIVNSEIESTVLKEIMKEQKEGCHAFIGYIKYYDGEWATVNGDTLVQAGFSGWDKGEPNNVGGKESCGSIYPNGLLNDATCSDTLQFICEFTPK